MKASANAPCPCGSGSKYKKCCGVYHRGKPAEPRRLMRARYCAYAVADVDYLISTTHPDGPIYRRDTESWASELSTYCRSTKFTKLTIHGTETEGNDASGDAFVTFTAEFERPEGPAEFTERSRFRRDGKRWKYLDGEDVPRP